LLKFQHFIENNKKKFQNFLLKIGHQNVNKNMEKFWPKMENLKKTQNFNPKFSAMIEILRIENLFIIFDRICKNEQITKNKFYR